MRFSITAYKKLIAVDAIFDAEGTPIDPKTKAPIENWVKGYSSNEFPNQANDFTGQGIWKHSGSITFFFGPYDGYNDWLNSLAKLAGYPETKCEWECRKDMRFDATCRNGDPGPFFELIYFSNSAGVIGSETAAKLAQDFAAYNERAMEAGKYFYKPYWKWHTACNTAADGGLVIMALMQGKSLLEMIEQIHGAHHE